MDKKIMVSVLLDFYGQLLSPRQLEMMNYYYNDDLSLREIAEMSGITRQGVYDIIKRSDTFLEELEEKLHLYHKWQSIEQDLNTVAMTLQTVAGNENCKRAIEMIEQIKNKF